MKFTRFAFAQAVFPSPQPMALRLLGPKKQVDQVTIVGKFKLGIYNASCLDVMLDLQ